MEAVVQRELFPVLEQKTRKRSFFREYVERTLVDGPLATPAMCAAAIGLSRQRIYELVSEGRIESLRIHGKMFITASSFEKFLCEERKTGRHLDYKTPETFREYLKDYKAA
jgi:hypothetical protein